MKESQERKARGAFFTPTPVTAFLARWAIRSPVDAVLEPSCGDAEFLISAYEELKRLNTAKTHPMNLHGVEIHPETCELARRRLLDRNVVPTIHNVDFFQLESQKDFDAVIGNPPYVRYQDFTGSARRRASEAALKQGVRLSGLSSSWAAFVVHASSFLKDSGRLGLVLPAELLSVNYASDVRRFLLERFARIRFVLFKSLLFPEVQEEVVLLLAEGRGPTDHFDLYEASGLHDLEDLNKDGWTTFHPETEGKWSSALLGSDCLQAFREIAGDEWFETLSCWGAPYLGMVTGNNKFFALTAEKAKELSLSANDLIMISPPGSRHLRGLSFSQQAWREVRDQGGRSFLFYPRGKKLSRGSVAYVAAGEKTDVHKAYKCRSRNPWWRVPLVPIPDLILTYMDQDQPRLVTNRARVAHLNSLYGIQLATGRKRVGEDLLPLAFLNSLTLLGAELVGRAYGGGILKLEPREADRIPVPSIELMNRSAAQLRALRPQLAKHLRSGSLDKASRLVDRTLLIRGAGVDPELLAKLRSARKYLRERRISRRQKLIHE